MRTTTGALIATLAAGAFASACQSANTNAPVEKRGETKAASSKVRCAGINECSGKGACASATNSCAGKNECKGKGWIEIEGGEVACTSKSGAIVKMDPMKGG